MKKLFFSILVLVFCISFFTIKAQEPDKKPEYKLTHHMTPEEMLRRDEIGKDFYPTDPPIAPVRQTAEFEQMQSVLIRYPFGIPMELIAEMSEDCMVTTIVENQSQENYVMNLYNSAGVNTANCDFIHAPTNSYWTRDYGPWFVVNGNNEVGICNFPYNRPRPDDNDIPIAVAQYLDIELYGMNLIHTGGNYMTDGMGMAASTTLVWDENPTLSHEDIDQLVEDYLGITTYHVLPDPLGEYIEHIDCWGKYIDVDKVLIGEVPVTDYRYEDFEYVADYFAGQTSSYGNLYQVYRIFTPGTYPYTPYTNSLILNRKVFVPQTGSGWDDEALEVYEEAMPGYEIIGIYSDDWVNTDALHCRTRGIADLGMLYIYHIPLLGEVPFQNEYEITASFFSYSNEPLYQDSLKIHYKVDGGVYTAVSMSQVFSNTYSGIIPEQPAGSEIAYFIHAADESGRGANHPYIGAPDPHVFIIGDAPPDITVTPDSLIFLTVTAMLEGKNVKIENLTDEDIYINDIENEGFNGGFHWYVDPWTITLPYLLTSGDSLILTVKIDVPLSYIGNLISDTMSIESEVSVHDVLILVDEDLVSTFNNLSSDNITSLNGNYPNPFSYETNIKFFINKTANVLIEIYNINGQKINTLINNQLAAGNYNIKWNGQNNNGKFVTDGIYFLKMKSGKFASTKKMILMK